MAVYEHAYRPYEGALTSARWRFLILPRYAYEAVFRSKIFIAYIALSFAPALAAALLIYLHHNLTALKMLHLQAVDLANVLPINGTFFLSLLFGQSLLAGLL